MIQIHWSFFRVTIRSVLCLVFAMRGRPVVLPCINPDGETLIQNSPMEEESVENIDNPTFRWIDHEGKTPHQARLVVSEVGDLSVDDVQPEDSGTWTCTVAPSSGDNKVNVTGKQFHFYHHLIGMQQRCSVGNYWLCQYTERK